jgi:hypothetical protein
MSPLLLRLSRVATARVLWPLRAICHFGLSANLALSERYARVAVNGKQGVRGYPQAGYLRLISLRTSSSNPQGQAEPSDGLTGMRTAMPSRLFFKRLCVCFYLL